MNLQLAKRTNHEVSITEILDGRLFIGNLPSAQDASTRAQHGITHVLSVCTITELSAEATSFEVGGAHHHLIEIEDNEYDDLLIHLPSACSYIQGALDAGGRVLVHCVMGVSRSATVLVAFLMKTRGMGIAEALGHVRTRRPQVHPNYGFIKQLDAFARCAFEPHHRHPAYRSWKRFSMQDVTHYLNRMEDIATILPDKLLVASDIPEDTQQSSSMMGTLGVTHLITLSPATSYIPPDAVYGDRLHIDVPQHDPDSIMHLLPQILEFISRALSTPDSPNLVLIYSENEPRACLIAAAYLIATTPSLSAREVRSTIVNALPLFSPPASWDDRLRRLEDPKFRATLRQAISGSDVGDSPPSSAVSASSSSPTSPSLAAESNLNNGAATRSRLGSGGTTNRPTLKLDVGAHAAALDSNLKVPQRVTQQNNSKELRNIGRAGEGRRRAPVLS